MQRFAGDTGVPGSSGLKVPKGFNQGTEKERRLWTGELMEVLKGTERSGRKARTSRLDQPWADLVASTAGCLSCLGRALCDALVSTQACAPPGWPQRTACLTNAHVGRDLCVAAGGQHPRSPLCPLGGGFLHWSPVPPSLATQHLYPLSGSHCPSLCLSARLPLQTWHSLPRLAAQPSSCLDFLL